LARDVTILRLENFLPQSEEPADWSRLKQIFFEFSEKRSAAAREVSQRFAYYTTAETATKILKDRKLWMRNATTMNDFREIQHGWDCVAGALNAGLRDQLTTALDASVPGLTQLVLKALDDWRWHFLYRTYLICFSEHCPADDPDGALEDELGRLSMWRAYGQQSGVAFVLKGEALLSETNVLKVYSSPVAYFDERRFALTLSGIVDRIGSEGDFLRSQPRDAVFHATFNMLRFAVLCTKHPGFREEREWRAIYTPSFERSPHVLDCEEVVRGTPQIVCKIPLEQLQSNGESFDIRIPNIIDRIILGPCAFPMATADALVSLLVKAGMPDADKRIKISGIPLR
jgi:hypothetical protein